MEEEGRTVGWVWPVQIHRHGLCDQFQVPLSSETGVTRAMENKLATVANLLGEARETE
jgi:hypothetical protein